MKRWLNVWLLVLSMVPAIGQAQTALPLKTISGSDLGIQLSDHSYESDRDGAFAMSVLGKKIGIIGSFTQANSDWYWGGDARIATGATSFNSATLGRRSGDAETLMDFRLLVGRDIGNGSQVLSPYIGLGYRSMFSYLKGYTDTGAASASRSSTQSYIPLGVTHRFRAGTDARIATTLEYDYLLEGTQRTYYTDIIGYTEDLRNAQRLGYGARLNLAYETVRWSAGVFYHYWNIQESEVGTYSDGTFVYSTTEPHSITREVGLEIRYRFH